MRDHVSASCQARTDPGLAVHVGPVVGEHQERVVVTQRVDDRAQDLGVAVGELSLGNEFQHFGEFGVALDVGRRAVALGVTSATSCSFSPNKKKFSAPASSSISTLAPSSVPMVSAPLIMNFMFPVPEASLPAVEICSDRLAAG